MRILSKIFERGKMDAAIVTGTVTFRRAVFFTSEEIGR